MEENGLKKQDPSLDILGLGKTAKAIPPEIYTEASKGLIDAFTKIISPITEITSGVGRYIRQKFDTMVDVEKALGAYTVQRAVEKAQRKGSIQSPIHLKSFINSFEEASKESDPLLHEMWENILASQISKSNFHPRYVGILGSLSRSEAKLLMNLNTIDGIGEDWSGYLSATTDSFDSYVLKNHDTETHKWDYSCNILIELELAGLMAPHRGIYNEGRTTILYLTTSGKRFLSTVI